MGSGPLRLGAESSAAGPTLPGSRLEPELCGRAGHPSTIWLAPVAHEPVSQILAIPKIEQIQSQCLHLLQVQHLQAAAAFAADRPAAPLQEPQGQGEGLPAAALLQALLSAFLPPKLDALLAPLREDVLEGAGVAPEVFGDAEGGHDLGGGETLKTFRKNRQDQLDQIRPQRQNALAAGRQLLLLSHRQGEQGQGGIEIAAAGQGGEVHPGHVVLQKALQRAGLTIAQGQAPVGHQHQHPEMFHLLVLLQKPEGFRRKAAVEAPIGVHLHLQKHHRQLGAAAGVIAGPEHAIGVVGHLLEGHRPKHVGRVAVAWARGHSGQEMAHQIGQRPEDFGIPVIAGYGR